MPTQDTLLGLAVAGLSLTLSLLASGHAVLYKRDARAAVAWCGVIWLLPIAGAALYVLLGVNRIQRRAHALRAGLPRLSHPARSACDPGALGELLGPEGSQLEPLAALVGRVSNRPLLGDNGVRPLVGGDEAYPAMLAAIEGAAGSVALTTFIFDHDRAGRRFIEALGAAARRGVEVRVLIDGLGARYSLPTVVGPLRRAGVRTALFLPTPAPWRFRYSNLRSHRKLLIVDGATAFTGGMNIRAGAEGAAQGAHTIEDLHFCVEGPVVTQLQDVFAEDWVFATGEVLAGPAWFPPLEPRGAVLARAVPDGPDEDFEVLRLTLLGALTSARRTVLLVTPYFVPDASLLTALEVAALRGISVDIVLPERSNLRLVQWASTALLWQVLARGCRVWLSPPPFDHTKLLIVDGCWTFLGSANWDARSLRLNFELNLECYDRPLAETLSRLVQRKIARAHQVTFQEVEARPLLVRLRDGSARLLAPYL